MLRDTLLRYSVHHFLAHRLDTVSKVELTHLLTHSSLHWVCTCVCVLCSTATSATVLQELTGKAGTVHFWPQSSLECTHEAPASSA